LRTFDQKVTHFLAHFTDGNSVRALFKNILNSVNLHFWPKVHFYLAFALVIFYFLVKKCYTFSKGSRSLCSAPFNFLTKKYFFDSF